MTPLERTWNRFWFGLAVPASKLNLLRILFFGVLAVDVFLELEHAPRYGAGGFNVSHIPWLDGLGTPSRLTIVVLLLLQSYLAARVVFGVAVTSSVRVLALLYGITYLCSQLDSYQHHYLVLLLLVIASFVPWERARSEAEGAADPAIPSWALRLFTIQLALVYLWAAIAKMHPAWLDGSTLEAQMSVPWVRDAIAGTVDFGGMAWLIMLTELGLAIAIVFRAAWPVVWVIGVGLHLSIEMAGFKIGLFSYFMLGIYMLFAPDRWITAGARVLRRGWARARPIGEAIARVPRPALAAVCAGAALALVASLPFEASGVAAVLIGLAGALALWWPAGSAARVALGHTLACVFLLAGHLASDQAFDYYKYLAGTSRRLDDPDTMKMAYQRLNELAPDYGPAYYHLGNVARKDGDAAEALALYQRAQEREPPDPRPFIGAAQVHLDQGDPAAARAILATCIERVPDARSCRAALSRVPRSR